MRLNHGDYEAVDLGAEGSCSCRVETGRLCEFA